MPWRKGYNICGEILHQGVKEEGQVSQIEISVSLWIDAVNRKAARETLWQIIEWAEEALQPADKVGVEHSGGGDIYEQNLIEVSEGEQVEVRKLAIKGDWGARETVRQKDHSPYEQAPDRKRDQL